MGWYNNIKNQRHISSVVRASHNDFKGSYVKVTGSNPVCASIINKLTYKHMIKSESYDGILYQIEYKPELSQRTYTRKQVYHIKTEDDNYPHAHKAIESIMDDGSWRKGIWLVKNQDSPSMENALHTYHEFTYNEELDVYVYTFVRPYDD